MSSFLRDFLRSQRFLTQKKQLRVGTYIMKKMVTKRSVKIIGLLKLME